MKKKLAELMLSMAVRADKSRDCKDEVLKLYNDVDMNDVICGINFNCVRTDVKGPQGQPRFAMIGGIAGSREELLALQMMVNAAIEEAIAKQEGKTLKPDPFAELLAAVLDPDSTGSIDIAEPGATKTEEVECQCTNCTTRREILKGL